jgi:hypothetical protein
VAIPETSRNVRRVLLSHHCMHRRRRRMRTLQGVVVPVPRVARSLLCVKLRTAVTATTTDVSGVGRPGTGAAECRRTLSPWRATSSKHRSCKHRSWDVMIYRWMSTPGPRALKCRPRTWYGRTGKQPSRLCPSRPGSPATSSVASPSGSSALAEITAMPQGMDLPALVGSRRVSAAGPSLGRPRPLTGHR